MQPIHAIRKARADSRAGMTLTEVMLALAVFLIGSVSIVGLFVSASVLHAEGANRRTASFIAEELRSAALSSITRDCSARRPSMRRFTCAMDCRGIFPRSLRRFWQIAWLMADATSSTSMTALLASAVM